MGVSPCVQNLQGSMTEHVNVYITVNLIHQPVLRENVERN